MPKIRMVLHDGSRIADSRQLGNEFRSMKILDVTKATYHVGTQYYATMGAEEVTAINGIRKGADSGFQLYLAIESRGKVVQMGLPFVQGSDGQEKFLNAANLKVGELEKMTCHLPADAQVLLVWRLDRNMAQDITLSGSSIVASPGVAAAPHDFSMLDRKTCAACSGGSANEKISLVADIMEVKLFCGDLENPIRMATLLVPPPEAFAEAHFQPFPAGHLPGGAAPDCCGSAAQRNPLQAIADMLVQASWSEEARGGVQFLASGIQQQVAAQLAGPGNASRAPGSTAASGTAASESGSRTLAEQMPSGQDMTLVLYLKPLAAVQPPALPGLVQDQPAPATLNNAEARLWLDIYQNGKARPQPEPARGTGVFQQPAPCALSHASVFGLRTAGEGSPRPLAGPLSPDRLESRVPGPATGHPRPKTTRTQNTNRMAREAKLQGGKLETGNRLPETRNQRQPARPKIPKLQFSVSRKLPGPAAPRRAAPASVALVPGERRETKSGQQAGRKAAATSPQFQGTARGHAKTPGQKPETRSRKPSAGSPLQETGRRITGAGPARPAGRAAARADSYFFSQMLGIFRNQRKSSGRKFSRKKTSTP